MSRRPKQQISGSWIELIKSEVEKHFGQKILNTSDCKKLSVSIFAHTGQQISYNTLRRFYGLVGSNSITNKTTLDILAGYCGFTNFDILINKREKLDIHELNYYFIEILNENRINFKDIELLCREYGNWPQIYTFLQKCLLHGQRTIDIVFFTNFYLLPNIFNYSLNKRKHIFDIVQLYASILDHFSVETKMIIIKEIVKQENAIRFFFEIYVDIDNIAFLYNDVLQEYHKNTSSVQAYLFYYNLMVYRSFIIGDAKSLSAFYDKLTKMEFDKTGIHPALMGRYLASEIYYSSQIGIVNKTHILNEVEKDLETIGSKDNQALLQSQLYLIYIFQALQFSGNLNILSEIINSIDPVVINICDHLTDNATNHLKIYFAHHLILTGNPKEAEKVMDSISLKSFALFEKTTQTISYKLMIRDYFRKKDNKGMAEKLTDGILSLSKLKGFEIKICRE